MFPIIFYTFGKNVNSTKRPTAGGVSYDIHLLEPTSVTHPRVTLADKENPAFNPSAYNYAYIDHFGRYYFVTDWAWIGGRWAASLSVDVLASFKPQILESEQYVTRSAAEFDEDMSDALYPTTSAVKAVNRTGDNPFTSILSKGCYVLGVINNDPNTMGCASYYVLNNSQFRSLCAALVGDGQFSGFAEEFVTLTKSITSPFRYLTSCTWFPFDGFQTAGQTETLPYGWVTLLGVTAARLGPDCLKFLTTSIDIPKHPQAAERGRYLNKPPYSRYNLMWPAIGTHTLDGQLLGAAERLTVNFAVDPISGGAHIQAFADGVLVLNTTAQIGVPIQLSDQTADILGAMNSLGSLVDAQKMYLDDVLSPEQARMKFNGAVWNAINQMQPVPQTNGANGSASAFLWSPRLRCDFFEIVEEDNEHRGRPLMKKKQLAELEGFTLCSDAEIELPATSGEVESVKTFLNGGVYLE